MHCGTHARSAGLDGHASRTRQCFHRIAACHSSRLKHRHFAASSGLVGSCVSSHLRCRMPHAAAKALQHCCNVAFCHCSRVVFQGCPDGSRRREMLTRKATQNNTETQIKAKAKATAAAATKYNFMRSILARTDLKSTWPLHFSLQLAREGRNFKI